MRVLFWVQQLLGSGHLKRALTLARAMADEGLEVTLAAGGMPMASLLPAGFELVQLPAIRTSDPSFAQLVDAEGRPADDALWQERQAGLQRLLALRRPQVLITEMFPFGRRAFRRELLPLLEAAAAMRPRPWRLCSVRDILVRKPAPESYAWMRDLALAHYDRILVHTDPQLIPFDLTFPFAAALRGRLVDTGYVVDAAAAYAGEPRQARPRCWYRPAAGGSAPRFWRRRSRPARARPWRRRHGASSPAAISRPIASQRSRRACRAAWRSTATGPISTPCSPTAFSPSRRRATTQWWRDYGSASRWSWCRSRQHRRPNNGSGRNGWRAWVSSRPFGRVRWRRAALLERSMPLTSGR